MRMPRRRAAVTAAMVLGAAGVLGTSAPQTALAGGAFCDPGIDAQVQDAGVVAARGGSVGREPGTGQVPQDLPASAKGVAGEDFTATVPVYFRIVTEGTTGAVTNRQVAAQIDVLDTTFGGGEGGTDTGFSFTLAGIDRTDNADWFYAGIGGTNEHTMKQTLHRGGSTALNLYSTTAGAYLGWAYLPDILTKPGRRDRDARGRPLAQPGAHLLRGLQRQRRLRRRHPGPEGRDQRLPRGQGLVQGAGTRPDPQLHGLLVRLLLHGVHARADAADARRLALLPGLASGVGGHTSRLVAARAATASGSPPTSTTAWSRRPKA